VLARIGDDTAQPVPEGIEDPTPTFDTPEAAREVALAGFKEAVETRPNAATAVFAKLGQAGLLLDESKFDEAIALYEQVKSDPVAVTTPEVKGRALEGVALAQEGKGDADAALKAYQELENADIAGFKEVSWLAQARLLLAKGERDAAKEVLSKLSERLDDESRSPYLAPSLAQLQQVLDPEALAKKQADKMKDVSSDDLQKVLEQLQKQAGGNAPPAAP
jgi:hypothetical protein